MSALTIALIAFVCMFGGALLGAFLRPLLPGHHVSADSRDVIKLGAGLIATQAALVLGLLVSSAKGSFDTMNAEITQAGARIILLDHVLARYGSETQDARKHLQRSLRSTIRVLLMYEAIRALRPAARVVGPGHALHRIVQGHRRGTGLRGRPNPNKDPGGA